MEEKPHTPPLAQERRPSRHRTTTLSVPLALPQPRAQFDGAFGISRGGVGLDIDLHSALPPPRAFPPLCSTQ